MNICSYLIPAIISFALFMASPAQARIDTIELYENAVTNADIAELEKLLAPNFWYIGANGHIRDKEHFLSDLKDKNLVVDTLKLTNVRETSVGSTRLVTANGTFMGQSDLPRPQGLMRFSLVLAKNNGKEQVALFQATPVVPSKNCQDGNCLIK